MAPPLDILVLDDEHDAADMLSEVLTLCLPEAVVRIAHTGEDAVRLGNDRRPHVAILDLEMVGMGGEAAAQALRTTYRDQRIMLIALSGNTLRLAALRQRGPFDHLLSKPVDIAALLDLLNSCRPGA